MEPDKVFILQGIIDYESPTTLAASLDEEKLEKLQKECEDYLENRPQEYEFTQDFDRDTEGYREAEINYLETVEKYDMDAPVNDDSLYMMDRFVIREQELI